MSWLPYLVISAVSIIIGIVKVRGVRKKRASPEQMWEGESEETQDQRKREAHKDAEVRKGAGRAGGPL